MKFSLCTPLLVAVVVAESTADSVSFSGSTINSAGIKTRDSTIASKVPIATKIPKVRIGIMSLTVSEKKPTAVVIEVMVTGRASFSSIKETAFSRG